MNRASYVRRIVGCFSSLCLALLFAVGLSSSGTLLAQEPPEPAEVSEPADSVVPANTDLPTLEKPPAAVPPVEAEEGAPPEPVDESPVEEASANEPAESKPEVMPPDEAPIDPAHPKAVEKKQPATGSEDVALAELRRRAPRELLEIAGIDRSQLRPLQDGWPLGDNELEITLKLLYRISRFGQVDTALWSDPNIPLMLMANHPEDYRLQMYLLRGRVTEVRVEHPPQEVVDRYDFQEYYSCLVELDDANYPVLVVTPTIPKQWDLTKPINEPVSAQGMFVKVGEQRGDLMQLVFLASRIAWHPNHVEEEKSTQAVNLGMIELGRLGMDVGLLDLVQNRERITERDREAFYQMLAAVSRAPQNQLNRFALANLPELQKTWVSEIATNKKELLEQQAALKAFQGSAAEKQKLARQVEALTRRIPVLQKAVQDAQKGIYSVYPLFNLADEQHGQLVFLKGVARWVMKVELANPRNPESNSDIITRFGIDHYYQVAIFTDDSSDNPIIICVRDLPKGFPSNGKLNEAVQVAGFFFKTWAYFTTEGAKAEGQNPPEQHRQLAPLLIARSLTWVRDEAPPADSGVALTLAFVFMGLVVVAAVSVWNFNKRDEKFRKEVIVRKYDTEPGTSLNDAGLETVDGPDFSHLHEEGTATGVPKDSAATSGTDASPPSHSL